MERKCQEHKCRCVNLVDLFGNWPFIQPDAQLNINEKTFNKIVLDQLFEFRNDLLVKICNPIHLSCHTYKHVVGRISCLLSQLQSLHLTDWTATGTQFKSMNSGWEW